MRHKQPHARYDLRQDQSKLRLSFPATTAEAYLYPRRKRLPFLPSARVLQGAQAVFSSVGGAEELAAVVPCAATGRRGMDEADHHGNTPLLLALQLGRLECAHVSGTRTERDEAC